MCSKEFTLSFTDEVWVVLEIVDALIADSLFVFGGFLEEVTDGCKKASTSRASFVFIELAGGQDMVQQWARNHILPLNQDAVIIDFLCKSGPCSNRLRCISLGMSLHLTPCAFSPVQHIQS